MLLRASVLFWVALFLVQSQPVGAQLVTDDVSETNVDARIENLGALGELYGELRGLNEILLSKMKFVADAKNIEGVKSVFKLKENTYEIQFNELMRLASIVPNSRLARDAALLTLNTTYGHERHDAIDLLIEHHIGSPRMREAVTCLGYTSRSEEICRKVMENNTSPEVLAHAEFASLDLDGKSVSISEYRGKVTLIVFWAT